MCIIIDANVASEISRGTDAAQPVVDWLTSGPGSVVAGGRLTNELSKVRGITRFLATLKRAGRFRELDLPSVDKEEKHLEALGTLRSDDPHIVALARLSGARLLFSQDKNLHADFRDRNLIANPRGKIYQNAAHSHLLGRNVCPH